MRKALFEIYTWIRGRPVFHNTMRNKQIETSRIQSLYLYFIKIVPFSRWNIRFLMINRAAFRTAAGTTGTYITANVSLMNGCQNFSYVHISRKHWKCKYSLIELFVDVGESERVHLHAALMSAKDFIEASIFHRSKVKVIERLEQAWIQYLKEDLKLLLE